MFFLSMTQTIHVSKQSWCLLRLIVFNKFCLYIQLTLECKCIVTFILLIVQFRPNKQENQLPLMLVDRKSVFYRKHKDQKVYHNMQIMQVDRGIIVKSLDTRHLGWYKGFRLINDAIARFIRIFCSLNYIWIF